MLNLPPVRHAVAIRVVVRGVRSRVYVSDGEVSSVGSLTLAFIAEVFHLHRVVAPEVGLFVEEAVMFSTIPKSVPVGVANSGVG